MTSESGTPNDSVMIDNVVIRFAGDSGDGIQTTGSLFTHDSAVLGHDVSTLPDYPAEIRAPAGSLPGVSSFQLNFSSRDIHTPGDRPDVLVALNPAALKIHLADLVPGGTIIINCDRFTHQDLARAGYDGDPVGDGSLSGHRICPLPIESLTIEAVKSAGVGRKQASLCKNMFTLGLISELYDRSLAAVNGCCWPEQTERQTLPDRGDRGGDQSPAPGCHDPPCQLSATVLRPWNREP